MADYIINGQAFTSSGDPARDLAGLRKHFPDQDPLMLSGQIMKSYPDFKPGADVLTSGQPEVPAQAKPDPSQPSKLSALERLMTSFGNQPGIQEFLQKKGYQTQEQDGELFAGGAPVDPDNTKALLRAVTTASPLPGAQAFQLYDLVQSLRGKQDPLKENLSALKDSPYDALEIPAEIPGMITTAVGTTGGGALGGLTGNPLAAGAGAIAGGGAGGVAGEKIKESIGSKFGTYKTNGEFFTPEATEQGVMSALMALLDPAASQNLGKAGQGVLKKGTDWLTKREVPQKMYAKGSHLEPLLEKTADDLLPDADPARGIQKLTNLLKRNLPVREKPLIQAVTPEKKSLGALKEAHLDELGDIPIGKIIEPTKGLEKKLPITSRNTARNALDNVNKEVELGATVKDSLDNFTMKNAKFPDYATWEKGFDEKMAFKNRGGPKTGASTAGTGGKAGDVLDYQLDQVAKGMENTATAPVKNKTTIIRKGHGTPVATLPKQVVDESVVKSQIGPSYSYKIPKDVPEEVLGSGKVGQIASDEGTGFNYHRKPTPEEKQLLYLQEKTKHDALSAVGPKQEPFISVKDVEMEKQLLDDTWDSDAEGKRIRNEVSNVYRTAARDASDKFIAEKGTSGVTKGKTLKDINTEYDPLRQLEKGIMDNLNARDKQGLVYIKRGPKGSWMPGSPLIDPAIDASRRKGAQVIFNYNPDLSVKQPALLDLLKIMKGMPKGTP